MTRPSLTAKDAKFAKGKSKSNGSKKRQDFTTEGTEVAEKEETAGNLG